MLPTLYTVCFAALLFITSAQVPPNNGEWNYDNPNADWGNVNPTCNGSLQSGIALKIYTSAIVPLKTLTFTNYDVPLNGTLLLRNDGHTAIVDIPVTQNGGRPSVSGGLLNSVYEAVNIHFHWGSNTTKGSEHSVDGTRFDVELHIVHKNVKYPTVEEAIQNKDGLAVLGIFLKQAEYPDRVYPGLEKIYKQLPNITFYRNESQIEGTFTMDQILGDVDTNYFFSYQGSLTTPPCAEAVSWIVFPTPLVIGAEQNSMFFNLRDLRGQPLLNNFRPIQPRNGRPVFYRLNILKGQIP